jgi:methyltransferase-like protein
MSHRIHKLKDNLYFITWLEMPKIASHENEVYVEELSEILEKSTEPLYFITDMRRAHLSNPRALSAVAKAMNHSNFGAGASFSNDAMADVHYSLYLMNTIRHHHTHEHEAPELFHRAEDAIAFIEDQVPGITSELDWRRILHESEHS